MSKNREQWLTEAVEALTPLLGDEGFSVPEVRVSTGFPSRGGLSAKKRVIGQCWAATASKDGVPHIFVSPVLDKPRDVLSTLLHELIHASVGTEEGHKGQFVTAAKAVGFEGPWTQTPVGEALAEVLDGLAEELGEYPHTKLDPAQSPIKKQTTRMIRLDSDCEDGCTVRTTRKWIEKGDFTCPCGGTMRAAE